MGPGSRNKILDALQPPPLPWIFLHPVTANPTLFFDVTVNSKPLGRVSFKLFADKFPKTAENFHALSTGKKKFGIKVPAFIELFWDLCARVVTSHATMAQAASPTAGRNLMIRVSS